MAMMTNVQAIILGITQGLTEYLPISSSAHLVLLPHFMGWKFLPKESFVFDVLIQLGTLVGVLFYFFTFIKSVALAVVQGLVSKEPFNTEEARLGWLVVLASIPAAIIGLTFKDELSAYFSSPMFSCYFLILTGIFLILAEILSARLKSYPNRFDAIMIGFAQSLALLPGISRSGATIAAGMLCGLSRINAARFSFLMAIPVMLGASLVAFLDLLSDKQLFSQLAMPLIFGFFSAAISGYLVIKWLMLFLTSKRLIWFGIYCLSLGGLGIFYFI
jgi:undecaprenyl-diphosphatase